MGGRVVRCRCRNDSFVSPVRSVCWRILPAFSANRCLFGSYYYAVRAYCAEGFPLYNALAALWFFPIPWTTLLYIPFLPRRRPGFGVTGGLAVGYGCGDHELPAVHRAGPDAGAAVGRGGANFGMTGLEP